MSTTKQKAASALAQINECLYDHGAGKYQGAVSAQQRNQAFDNARFLAAELRRLSAENEALRNQSEDRRAQIERMSGYIHTCGPNCTKAGCVNARLTTENAELATQLATKEGELATLRAQVEALTKPQEPAKDDPRKLQLQGLVLALARCAFVRPVTESMMHQLERLIAFCFDNGEEDFARKLVLLQRGVLNPRRRSVLVPSSDSAPSPLTRPVYLVATGEVHEGQETYTRHDAPVPMADQEVLFTRPPEPLTRPAVPEGWKLVPVEPTIEMRENGSIASEYDLSQNRALKVYCAMLAATPQPEAQPTEAAQKGGV